MRGALLLCLLVSGCCLPVPRRAITQPAMVFEVRDANGDSLNAEMLVATWSNPHHRYHGYEAYSTEAGKVAIEQKRTFEWILPLMIHGIPFYYWTWCVQATGFAPVTGSTHDLKPEPIQVEMKAGDGECDLPGKLGP